MTRLKQESCSFWIENRKLILELIFSVEIVEIVEISKIKTKRSELIFGFMFSSPCLHPMNSHCEIHTVQDLDEVG